jgi:hypothetical protein
MFRCSYSCGSAADVIILQRQRQYTYPNDGSAYGSETPRKRQAAHVTRSVESCQGATATRERQTVDMADGSSPSPSQDAENALQKTTAIIS